MSPTPGNRLRGIVRSVTHRGGQVHVVLDGPDGEPYTTVLMAQTAARLDLRPGDEIEATVHVAEVVVNGRRAQSVVRTPVTVADSGTPDRTVA
ncbi:TOBE domain-containing protein [Halogranum gelatinilyticum]|uniref:TOBE domain-containing protein n=1 Tax=Halogranum gelatinilyticum TaxID=660521 RepID=A0A1G9T4T8_9EURY|nr:TOBE domain-containing protein [Halogranum gelatinilyticum]SDM42105.1 TOBE domain-containing protein [Halogranum gelatinilyticum]